MNIGIDARCLSEGQLSGVGNYTSEMIHALLKLDTKNQYYLYVNSWRGNKNSLPEFDYLNVHYVVTHFPNKLLHVLIILRTWPYLDTFFPVKLDVFWEPAHHFLALSPSLKLIVTCHDISWEFFPDMYTRKGLLWHRALKLSKLYSRATKVIAVSQNTKNDLIRFYGLPANKIKVVYSGLPSKQIFSGNKEISLPSKKYFLYLGNIEPRKNIESIIEAFLLIKDKLPGVDLIIAGGVKLAPRYAKKIINKLISERGIYYLGYVDNNIKQKLYSQALAFIFPSWHEGFGFPPLEALAANVPVIASNVTALPEVLGSAAYYINPYNIAELADSMLLVATDYNLRQTLQSAGQLQASKYNWESAAWQLLAEFNAKI
jgi:glycosyltransferase involved in cell wall biosynthesis